MEPRIETVPGQKFVGQRIRMSFSSNMTYELWSKFMPRRQEIRKSKGTALYSIEVYPTGFFDHFDLDYQFEKWAAVEVTDINEIPEGMESLSTPGGLYAVFIHRGPASEGPKTYQHIFGAWLPGSGYLTDNRPHFAVMGEKYKKDDPGSEEEIFIPIRRR